MKLTNVKKVENMDQEVEAVLNSQASKSGKMKELFQLGMEIKDIAGLMGVRYNFVYNVVSNMVITQDLQVEQEKKESKKDKVIELIQAGKTNIEIARILKTNYNYIYKISKEYKAELDEVAITK